MIQRDGGDARVHLVVSCANRKTRPVPSLLRLRQIVHHPRATRAAMWVDRLERSTESIVPARQLYAGEHWQIVRELETTATASGLDVSLWVCSAGYGLISVNAELRPYAATFATGHPDSVSADPDMRSQWWADLAGWPGPRPDAPRTIRDLARREPHDILLVALSATYLAACVDDVMEAAAELSSPEQLTVISVGTRASGPLARHLAPGSARLQPVLGGTRQALNARVLSYLLSHQADALTYPHIAGSLDELLAAAPPLVRYARTPRTDAQVATFIRRRFASDTGVAASRLLREFRDRGYACEQRRFSAIYRTVREDPDPDAC
jgi:hypothetical protein